MTILIVEDNLKLAANLRDLLQLEGHAVVVAHDGEEGLRRPSPSASTASSWT